MVADVAASSFCLIFSRGPYGPGFLRGFLRGSVGIGTVGSGDLG